MPEDRRPFHNKVFFCDIVGYSKLDATNQFRCQQQLTHILRASLAEMRLKLDHDAIALPTGDGVVLNFIVQEPDIHLRMATEVLRRLDQASPDRSTAFGLRIGLNSQVDTMVVDINNQKNIVGNGINLAQRVMDLASPSQILMHDRVRLDLENYTDYIDKIVYRGEFPVKHGSQVPVAQFVDPARSYLNSGPVSPPKSVRPGDGGSIQLESILEHGVQGTILRLALDARARSHMDDIREYIQDYLDERGEFQRLKVAVTWIAIEMLQNVFEHAALGTSDGITLRIDQTKAGVLVSVDQPDVAAFDLEAVLYKSEPQFSFMRLMDKQGFRWRQRRLGSRLTLSLEVPRDLKMPTLNVLSHDANDSSLPPGVSAFISGEVDSCTHDRISMLRIPWGRVDQANVEQFEHLLRTSVDVSAPTIIDLGRVEYISSAGLRVLMLLAKRAHALGKRVVLASLKPLILEIFQLSKFNVFFDLYETSESAYRALTEKLRTDSAIRGDA